MNLLPMTCLTLLCAALALPGPALAHGGQYRGPGNTAAPPGGGRDSGSASPSTAANPASPEAPAPSSSGTPVPTPGAGSPQPAGRGPAGAGGVSLGEDLSHWNLWWEFNKAPFLQLKKAIYHNPMVVGSDDFLMGRGRASGSDTLAPGRADLERIVSALKRVLEECTNRDIISSALVGLAKIHDDATILPLLRRFLRDHDQEKRETATLAIGIVAAEAGLGDLIALALDEPAGRQLVDRSEVDFRTRSFACYGLGLIAYRSKSVALKQKVYAAMRRMVERGLEERVHRDLIVSPLQAMRLLRPDPRTAAGSALRDQAVEFLRRFMLRPDREVWAQLRSHAYVALAALLGKGGDQKGRITERMLRDLRDRGQKAWIHQSAILALGQIALPETLEVSKTIQLYLKTGKDLQARNFCGIALGRIGGAGNRSFLIANLKRIRTGLKPWLALGLAVMDHESRGRDPSYEGDPTAESAIRAEFDRSKNPLDAAGLALALGLMRDHDSGAAVLERLLEIKQVSEPAGYMAVALGLMGHQDARSTIQDLLSTARRRPRLLTQCAVALGLLGDKQVSLVLISHIQEKQVVAVYSAMAQALGSIGDKRSIGPLIAMLEDTSLRSLPRAFAAVALGLVGDKEPLPWNSKIAAGNNYRANVETLTSQSSGILDIL
ncbi:MAG: hypothetical protein ACE5F1_01905 [Planctomycetota bacterium]